MGPPRFVSGIRVTYYLHIRLICQSAFIRYACWVIRHLVRPRIPEISLKVRTSVTRCLQRLLTFVAQA
jgi:hypothetical protein